MGRSSGHRKSPSSVRLIPSVRVINMVKRSRLKAKVELKSRRSSRRPSSPEGLLIEDVEDEVLPAGTKMTDSWIEELKVCESLGEWSELVGSLFSRQDTFKELGLTLLELISRLPTPLGRFTREYCDSARPHPGATPKPQRGDILPIAPWRISTRIEGITEANQAWVWLLVVIHNFNYCTGWQKPVCVPFHDSLNENQLKALTGLGKLVDRNIMSGEPLGTLGEAKKLLSSKKFDYAGKPIEYMEDLEAWRVEPAWPKKGEAGIQPIEKYLSRETREQMKDPRAQLLPIDLMPSEVPRSRVRATDDEWFKICKMAHERGMMKVVDDGHVPRDRSGHLITNGAGAVKKEKMINGELVVCQRFISILVPTNSVTSPILGAQDTLPYIGTMAGLMLQEDETLLLDSEDLQSAFNLFAMPDAWLGFFAYSKKVDGAAFGLKAGTQVRPALSVVPMGWHSAVGLVQEAVRFLVFEKSRVPRERSVEKGLALPEGKKLAVVYLDNFDEITILKKFSKELEESEGVMTESHKRFIRVCDKEGLPRNAGKQLVGAMAGGMQGGEFDGDAGVLKVGSDKLRSFLQITLALLASKKWSEFNLRHWAGKAAFCAAFRRLLFSNMFEVFKLIETSTKGDVQPTEKVLDEILCFSIGALQAEIALRQPLSEEVSCTDASPSGGGSAVATAFKDTQIKVPDAVLNKEECGVCGFRFSEDERVYEYACGRGCGSHMCSASCYFTHAKSHCSRGRWWNPSFGERFSGPNYPLTKAMALQGLDIQVPLDKLIPEMPWDFFEDEGKKKLEEAEDEPDLLVSHWAPECKTFSRSRGKPIQLQSGRWIQGPKALRNDAKPWGLPGLGKNDQVKVRQGNGMARRSIKGVKEAALRGRFASLEHPHGSLLWSTAEAKELMQMEGIYVTEYSHCCYGGSREKWQRLVHNMPEVHEALHKPFCPGHAGLLTYEVHETSEGLVFDTETEAEYPWAWCKQYALGVRRMVNRLYGSKLAICSTAPVKVQVFSALKRSTKGMQSDEVANRVTEKVCHLIEDMKPGQETAHLKSLIRQVATRGCDIKLETAKSESQPAIMSPYPAFLWHWKTILSYRWSQPQHINVLEISAFLVELRRRTRVTSLLHQKFVNITDSRVMFHVLTKGRSSSERLNRIVRRIGAVSMVSQVYAYHLWTISKWNFADHASRRFDNC